MKGYIINCTLRGAKKNIFGSQSSFRSKILFLVLVGLQNKNQEQRNVFYKPKTSLTFWKQERFVFLWTDFFVLFCFFKISKNSRFSANGDFCFWFCVVSGHADKKSTTSEKCEIHAMPTFHFHGKRGKVAEVVGASEANI